MQPASGLLTLYIDAFWASPYDATCHAAMTAKGVMFNTSNAMVREGQGLQEVYRVNALIGRVPVLKHGDFWLSESMAIVEYLEEVCPPPEWPRVFPPGVRGRARARQLMLWLRVDLRALREERASHTIFYRHDLPPLSEPALRDAEELVHVTERLLSAGSEFLFGEWSIADVDLAFMLMRLIRNGHELPEAVRRFAEGVWSHPAMRPYVVHARPPHSPV